jgi:hypothetical protein
MAKHTPGPWGVLDHAILSEKVNAYGNFWVAGFGRGDAQLTEEDHANARLIAAAPELLDGCNAALAYLADPPSEFKENRKAAVAIIRAAIAKATS